MTWHDMTWHLFNLDVAAASAGPVTQTFTSQLTLISRKEVDEENFCDSWLLTMKFHNNFIEKHQKKWLDKGYDLFSFCFK